MSDDFWRSHFNGNPRIVGETIELNKHPFTVVGIAPQQFHGTELFMWPDYWVPIVNQQQIEGDSYLNNRGDHVPWLLGRLKPGVTAHQATDNLNAVARQMIQEHPNTDDGLYARKS